ncbi:arginyltransferase [Gluconobacter morbifer]|uniref:Aspartate/glutamate leucyltransferase n=1 Tax=Gluconobacter morbifer G707 TaxID=1088869 RepID=G6XIC3_9PROT|nr:arginyltransferase [Gluconobacter morbifer]EHH68563.1 arginyl-tRNA-protein transferase [Gluconobacter morbifer G707]
MQHHPQLFYTTAPAPCPYLPNRTERKVLTELTGRNATALHDRLAQAGFRRSHTIAYAPVCPACRACVPIRIPVSTFRPTRTQRRTRRRHEDLIGRVVPPVATQEQYRLFVTYQASRHTGGDMTHMSWTEYADLIGNTPVDTFVVEFRQQDGTLVCVSLVDRMADGLSAVYTFYDVTDLMASWGTYSILWLMDHAAALGLPYLYLGYYVPGSRKMAYKANFQPAEILRDGEWLPCVPEQPSMLPSR